MRSLISSNAISPLVESQHTDPEVLLDMELDGLRVTVRRQSDQPSHRGVDLLSPREREIARMIAAGYTNKTIASLLEISLWTVSTHLRRIFAKLGVSTRAAMVAAVMAGELDRRPGPYPH